MSASENSAEIRVVNLRREPYDIYIGRPGKGQTSIWGNPYQSGRDGTRSEVCEKYRSYVLRRPHLLARLRELDGMRLGCFCAPQQCHGDVLKELRAAQLSGEI